MPARETYVVKHGANGTVALEYSPAVVGQHELNISCNEKALEGTPFRCHVDKQGAGFVTAYGDGLSSAKCGQEAEFTVLGNGAEVTVEGRGRAELKKEERDGATHAVFVPMSPGEYAINVKVAGKHIHGSPFSCIVSGEGQKRSQLVLSGSSDVELGGQNVDLTGLIGFLKTPAGETEPVLLKKTSSGKLGIASFAPKSQGVYQVDVTQDGSKYAGSPFKVNVAADQVSSASKVQAKGAVHGMQSQQWNMIDIDLASAGYGHLSMSIEGGHRCDMEEVAYEGKQYKCRIRPHEPGHYMFNIKFADDHIAGSPISLAVGGEPSGRIRETVVKKIVEAAACGPKSKCEFQLKIPGADPLEMEASLTTPAGKTSLCEIRDLPDAMFDIKFVPEVEGVHTVSLKHRGLHIAGSPFQFTVGQPPNAGAHKVEIGGPGLEKGSCVVKNEFNIYTREAGGGELSVSVEGPSKAALEVTDRGHGYTTVAYVVTKPGDYGIHVKYDGAHVPDSPSRFYITPHSAGAGKVCAMGIRDRGHEPGKHVTFNINKSGQTGELHATLDTPSGTAEDIFMQELDRELFAVRFIPQQNGVYFVNIRLDEAHINGSPFPILIGKLGADAALVMATGDGLNKGECGNPTKFHVVTTNSGTGVLSASISGPSKVAIQCAEVDDGYIFTYVPMAPGEYLINIKYSNVTIAGCPTKAIITGSGKGSDVIETSQIAVETVEKKPGSSKTKHFKGDASKVVVKGAGLKKVFVGRPAIFTIECAGAGNALLMAGVISAQGNPIEELTIKRTKTTTFTGTLKTKEKGEHTMIIRWGADDVPGSPFTIPCA